MKHYVLTAQLFDQLSEDTQKEISNLLASNNENIQNMHARSVELAVAIQQEKDEMRRNGIDTIHIDSNLMSMISEEQDLKEKLRLETDADVFAELLSGRKIASSAWPAGSYIMIGEDGDCIDEKGEHFSDLDALIGFELEVLP